MTAGSTDVVGNGLISFNANRGARRLTEKTANPALGLAAGFLVLAVMIAGLRYFGSQFWPYFIAATFLIILGESIRSRRKRSPHALSHERRLPSDLGSRIRVYGNSDELTLVAEVIDAPFEPEVFQRVYEGNWIALGIIIGATLGVIAGIRLNTSIKSGAFGGFSMAIGQVIGWAIARLRPTYYRIVPGRLDIMRFNPLTNRAKMLSQWPLTQVDIRIAFHTPSADLTGSGPGIKIKLNEISEPYRFVRALLNGAICSYLAPPLPDDRLLG